MNDKQYHPIIEEICKKIIKYHSEEEFRQEEELQWVFAKELRKILAPKDCKVIREEKTIATYIRKDGILEEQSERITGRRLSHGKIDIVIKRGEEPIIAIEIMYPRGRGKTSPLFNINLKNNETKLIGHDDERCHRYILYFYEGERNKVFPMKDRKNIRYLAFALPER